MTVRVQTEVQAGYLSTEDYQASVLSLERDSLSAPYGEVFIRLYSLGSLPKVLSTSGSPVVVSALNVVSEHAETLFFQGTDVARFSRPIVSNVSIYQVGRFLDLSGAPVMVNLTVNEFTGEVRANKPVYGTVQSIYRSSFTRMKCEFQKLQDASDSASEFAPMQVVAFNTSGGRAALNLDPPQRLDNGGGTSSAFDRADGEFLVLELDTKFPTALSHNDNRFSLTAVSKFYLYDYGDSVSVQTSLGLAVRDLQSETLSLSEGLSFNGSSSQSIRYPPINGLSVSALGVFFSPFIGQFSASFVAGGGLVTTVEWLGDRQFVLTGNRLVKANEVALTSPGGILTPGTGMARATYATSRTGYTLRWSRKTGVNDWFDPVVVMATDSQGRSATLIVQPPNRRGV